MSDHDIVWCALIGFLGVSKRIFNLQHTTIGIIFGFEFRALSIAYCYVITDCQPCAIFCQDHSDCCSMNNVHVRI